ALGGGGGSLGFAGMPNSAAVKFDTYPNDENQTGIYADGTMNDNPAADPTNPQVNEAVTVDPAATGIHFSDGHTYHVALNYRPNTDTTGSSPNGTLTETITRADDPTKTFSQVYTGLDIKAAINSDAAFVGVSAATGGANEQV